MVNKYKTEKTSRQSVNPVRSPNRGFGKRQKRFTSNRVKVLLIEDSPSDTRLIQEVLKDKPKIKGCKLITAETGEEGLKRANLEKPDLIMIDTLLPGIDGFETCRQIRKIKGFSPKIIVYTGVIDAVDAEKAKLAGADDYVVKTADFSALIEAMGKLI